MHLRNQFFIFCSRFFVYKLFLDPYSLECCVGIFSVGYITLTIWHIHVDLQIAVDQISQAGESTVHAALVCAVYPGTAYSVTRM